jgi:hypothetical protein
MPAMTDTPLGVNAPPPPVYTAFLGTALVHTGPLPSVARACARAMNTHTGAGTPLVFDDRNGQLVELDLRGTPAEAAARATQMAKALAAAQTAPQSMSTAVSSAAPEATAAAASAAPRGRGRPQLGVVAREVTLLPRHWEWLALQPGGASVTLRKLIDEARRTTGSKNEVRVAQERCYRFMSPVAGNLTQFEDATRALFSGKLQAFESAIAAWPKEVARYAQQLASGAFPPASSGTSK